jgi:nicotinamidase-related amidase
MLKATPVPASSLLAPSDHALILIDYQPQMLSVTRSIDVATLRSNAALIANAAVVFKVPLILTTVDEKGLSGPMFEELVQVSSGKTPIDRSTMNAWEDSGFIREVDAAGRNRMVMAGLWTSVCIAGPALSALGQGFDVYVITDACGDVSREAHERAVTRMVQAGAKPLTSIQYMLELQRDWAREPTADLVGNIARRWHGAHALGVTSGGFNEPG